jgi:hypothetical protein
LHAKPNTNLGKFNTAIKHFTDKPDFIPWSLVGEKSCEHGFELVEMFNCPTGRQPEGKGFVYSLVNLKHGWGHRERLGTKPRSIFERPNVE